jgi:predicted dehydrogenase
MKTVRVGVIGVGHLGSAHAGTYRRLAGVDLMGVYDADENRARAQAEELGCGFYPDVESLLADVDAVSVVVPTAAHFEIGIRALEHGLHVLMEKPIARTLEEADRLIEAADEKNVIFQVGHIERFNPAVRKGSAVVHNPLFLECHRLSPFQPRGTDVDVILDLMIHDIDLALKFVDSEVKSISAIGVPVITKTIDIANARITFENRAVANITASRISKSVVRKMRIFQKDAYISMNFYRKTIEVIRLNRELNHAGVEGAGPEDYFLVDRSVVDEGDALDAELASFIECVRTDTAPRASSRDGRKALYVASCILDEIEDTTIGLRPKLV